MLKNHQNKISLDQLASFSAWPARLLSLENFEIKHKTPESITREFGEDKWGKLLQYFHRKDNFSLADVEEMEQNIDEIIPCFEHDIGFYLSSAKDAHKKQIEIFKENLIPFIDDASGLVELGAGYGSKLFSLSEIQPFNDLPLFAAEYTQSGCDLIKLIADKIDKDVKVGRCDFDKLYLDDIEIPENSIIFTSYSVHYVPSLKTKFIDFILKLKPKVVIHFEPCYEYFDELSLYGLMCKRYMEINGYTLNIASAITEGCIKNEIKFQEQKNIFGTNPFLPFSIVKWFPNHK